MTITSSLLLAWIIRCLSLALVILMNSLWSHPLCSTIHALIKMITTIPQDKIDSIGRISFYHRDYDRSKGIINEFDEDYFTGGNKDEKQMIKDCKTHGLSMTAPLFSDISSLDAYLLDSVDVRIPLELANKFLIHTSTPAVSNLSSRWLSYGFTATSSHLRIVK